MDVYAQIVQKIIESQEAIIGPVAIEQAQHIDGMKLDWSSRSVDIQGNKRAVIDDLVDAYKELFGQIAVEVSKEAAAHLLPQLPADQLPASLQ